MFPRKCNNNFTSSINSFSTTGGMPVSFRKFKGSENSGSWISSQSFDRGQRGMSSVMKLKFEKVWTVNWIEGSNANIYAA